MLKASLHLQGPAPSPAAYDDGLVEVYGLTAGALKQGWNVRTVESHTKRLGQGHGLRLYVQSSDSTEHSVYTLMDGEDWWQRVPATRNGTSIRDGMLVRSHHLFAAFDVSLGQCRAILELKTSSKRCVI